MTTGPTNSLGQTRYFKFLGNGGKVDVVTHSSEDIVLYVCENGVVKGYDWSWLWMDPSVSGLETKAGTSYVVVVQGQNESPGTSFTTTVTLQYQ